MPSGEQDAAASAHAAPGWCKTEGRLLSPECAPVSRRSRGAAGAGPAWGPLPVADADPLLPHGVEQHGDAVQGLGDVWHRHGGAGPPQAEEQLLDVADAAGQEDDGRHQGPHVDALRREAERAGRDPKQSVRSTPGGDEESQARGARVSYRPSARRPTSQRTPGKQRERLLSSLLDLTSYIRDFINVIQSITLIKSLI